MVLREVCFTNIFNLVILAFHPTWLELRRVFWTSQWLTRDAGWIVAPLITTLVLSSICEGQNAGRSIQVRMRKL